MTSSTASTDAAIQAARTGIAAQIQAYRDLVGAASKASGMSLTRIDAALAAFEPAFFNNLLVALDARFRARLHGAGASLAGASGEVRLLADSLLLHGGVLTADPAVRYDADAALLRLDLGERIALNAEDVETLCAPFLAEIERTLA
jgi:hypothetical protein